MDKIKFIKNAVDSKSKEKDVIDTIISFKDSTELIPVFKVPFSTFVVAALILLEVEADRPDDEDIQIWKYNIKHS